MGGMIFNRGYRRRGAGGRAKLAALIVIAVSAILLLQSWQRHSPRRRAERMKILEKANNVPEPSTVSKAVVMGKKKSEKVGWVRDMAPEWISYIYTIDEEAGYPLQAEPKGREAAVYLKFIIDHYDGLPEITAFLHSTRIQWHNDVHIVGGETTEVFGHLQIDAIRKQGYVNLRCIRDPGCPVAINPLNPSAKDIREHDTRAFFDQYYMDLFNVSRTQIPGQIGGVCCAQFAVTRDQIRLRPVEDYVRMRNWALTVDRDGFGVGWVFENVWHIVFSKEAVHCPNYRTCRCELYALCNEADDPVPRSILWWVRQYWKSRQWWF